MEDENKRVRFDKSKIISEIITGSFIVIISSLVIFSLFIIVWPKINPNKDGIPNKEINKEDMNAQLNRIKEVIEKINGGYIDDVSLDDLTTGAIEGALASTEDPYTRYLTDEEYKTMLTSGTEDYGGIGVHLTYDSKTPGIFVLSVMPNSPAVDVGIQAGDIIIKVNDTVVTKENYNQLVDAMKGEPETTVNITCVRNDEVFQKTITRKKIAQNNVDSKVINNIGYIKIWSFDNNVANQFIAEYEKLKAKNISGLIIDLRNNPGGLVTDTIKIAQMLMPKGDVVKLVYKDGTEKVYKCEGKNEIQIPLAVLVNGNSASASEILAGALKDSNKATIIGTKTYGKGIVQTIQKLENGAGAISITTSKYYTASGIEIHKNGIEPNIVVELPDEFKNKLYVDEKKDTQLQKAIEIINSKK